MSVAAWVQERHPTDRVHLDAAAAGRVSTRVLEIQQSFLEREALVGAYVAEAAVQDELDVGRAALGALVGLTDAFFTDGAGTAFQVLLDAWPLPAGARIGTVAGEYGGNARVLRTRAAWRGWELVVLPTDPLGRILDVPSDLDLVTFPQVLSQRGVVQPVSMALQSGVPLLLDVAQAAGQTEIPAGAAAYVGTSRKWLCGPRGVGWGAVSPSVELGDPPTLLPASYPGELRRFDSGEPHVAGRLGLAHAARTWSPALLPVVQAGAAAARVLLEGAGGWSVIEPVDEPTGITTLTHPTQDPFATRAALLDRGFVVSVVPVSRAADMRAPVLRVSTPAWVTPGDLESLVSALDSLGSTG
ncbi:MAG: aminotransferase class [Frankiales bacterium]|nr:aminotransferase class [Frankiales bacterium]